MSTDDTTTTTPNNAAIERLLACARLDEREERDDLADTVALAAAALCEAIRATASRVIPPGGYESQLRGYVDAGLGPLDRDDLDCLCLSFAGEALPDADRTTQELLATAVRAEVLGLRGDGADVSAEEAATCRLPKVRSLELARADDAAPEDIRDAVERAIAGDDVADLNVGPIGPRGVA